MQAQSVIEVLQFRKGEICQESETSSGTYVEAINLLIDTVV